MCSRKRSEGKLGGYKNQEILICLSCLQCKGADLDLDDSMFTKSIEGCKMIKCLLQLLTVRTEALTTIK